MNILIAFIISWIVESVLADENYQGLSLGKFNSYAHQVAGEVYVIDEYTFLIKNFEYDGLGQDAFFWTGATVRPSNIGFIIPDENGRTNKLQRYINKDITIRMPDDKKVTAIKWLAVWDIRDNRNFADVYIPEGFEPPSPQTISELSRLEHDVKSGPVVVLDAKTIKIPDLHYDGKGDETYFWVGVGPQPNPTGQKIPDERGYLESLGRYSGEDVLLELPGDMTVFSIGWLSIWNVNEQENYGSITIPDAKSLNIPPSLTNIMNFETRLPNCEQLHRNIQLSWEIFGPQITFEVAAQMDENDYFAFGLSGSSSSSQMLGADVSISYLDGYLGYTHDYNITARYPCTNVLGLYKGVCLDTKVGGVDNYQIHTYTRDNGLTKLTFRRNLINTGDEGDQVFKKDGFSYIVWAVGKYNKHKEPRMHHIYPRGNVKIEFGRKPAVKNCVKFLENREPLKASNKKPWGPLRIFNQTLTTLYARLGVPGNQRGYLGSTGAASSGLVWYINGIMAPILYVKRGRTYTFRIEGGDNPHNAHVYHPLYITDDSVGGYIKQSENERKNTHVYAGISFDKKGRSTPMAAGRLCLWSYKQENDPRKSDNYNTFIQFRYSLNYTCEKGNPALLQWTPNASTPDVIYYQSYTQKNMGWKIVVLDDFSATVNSSSKVGYIFINQILLIVTALYSF